MDELRVADESTQSENRKIWNVCSYYDAWNHRERIFEQSSPEGWGLLTFQHTAKTTEARNVNFGIYDPIMMCTATKKGFSEIS